MSAALTGGDEDRPSLTDQSLMLLAASNSAEDPIGGDVLSVSVVVQEPFGGAGCVCSDYVRVRAWFAILWGISASTIVHFCTSDRLFMHGVHDLMVSHALGEAAVRGMMRNSTRSD